MSHQQKESVMKKVIGTVVFAAAALIPGAVNAQPSAVIVAPTVERVGVPATFDSAGSTCDTTACSYRWTASWRGSNYAVHTLATYVGRTFTYTPEPADTTRVVTVLLKVTNSGSTNNFGQAQVSFRAQP